MKLYLAHLEHCLPADVISLAKRKAVALLLLGGAVGAT
jgi:hypothetical protein